MRLFAISDLHLGSAINLEVLQDLPRFPDDWLIVAGDVAETFERFETGLRMLDERFARVLWVPGNHELWTLPGRDDGLAGDARYRRLVEIARGLGVLTPEDPWIVWLGPGEPVVLVLMFLLYDYSFAPEGLTVDEVRAWAAEHRIRPVDEALLHSTPFASRADWCRRRVAETAMRLDGLPADARTVLVNHYPLRQELVTIPRIPRFAPWCGTKLTTDWHRRFRAVACIHGHLHVRGRHRLDGVTFHEVSLGYPRQWDQDRGIAAYLRPIMP
jgi:hypothetical protein